MAQSIDEQQLTFAIDNLIAARERVASGNPLKKHEDAYEWILEACDALNDIFNRIDESEDDHE